MSSRAARAGSAAQSSSMSTTTTSRKRKAQLEVPESSTKRQQATAPQTEVARTRLAEGTSERPEHEADRNSPSSYISSPRTEAVRIRLAESTSERPEHETNRNAPLSHISTARTHVQTSESRASDGVTSAAQLPRNDTGSTVIATIERLRRRNQLPMEHKADDPVENTVSVGQAPVLKLWIASVASFIYPHLSWQSCLSAACAVASIEELHLIPRWAIGVSCSRRRLKHDEILIMGYKIKIREGHAILDGQCIVPDESVLIQQFGAAMYDKTKRVFLHCLSRWRKDEDNVNDRAWGMYEDFKPTTPNDRPSRRQHNVLYLDIVRRCI